MMNSEFATFWGNEDGQDLVEYSLLLVFIAVSAIAIIGSVGNSISTLWSGIATTLSSSAAS